MGKRLVRDRALESWVVPGAEHQVRPVRTGEEHLQLLHAKLIEEAMEVVQAETQRDVLKELADVLAVLEAIAMLHGIDWDEVAIQVDVRELKSGGFTEGMVWETSR